MRILAIGTLVAFGASWAMANTVIVIHSYLPSSPNPCIAVERHGKRVRDLPVKLYQAGTNPGNSACWASSTNKDGMICPSNLADGKYEIYTVSGRRSAELDLDVGKDNEVSAFKMVLRLSDQLGTAARAPVAIWAQQFRGVVEDASGVRKESVDEIRDNSAANIQSNDRGQFDCHLDIGAYVAIFE